jgi:hypothetical protein
MNCAVSQTRCSFTCFHPQVLCCYSLAAIWCRLQLSRCRQFDKLHYPESCPIHFTVLLLAWFWWLACLLLERQFRLLQWTRLFVIPAFFFKASITLKMFLVLSVLKKYPLLPLFPYWHFPVYKWSDRSDASCYEVLRAEYHSKDLISWQITSLLLTTDCVPNHRLISAPILFGIYWCHLQGVILL